MEGILLAKKERSLIRKMFDQTCRDLDNELNDTTVRNHKVIALLGQLEDKAVRIFELDSQLRQSILSSEDETEIEEEFNTIELYRNNIIKYRTRCDLTNESRSEDCGDNRSIDSGSNTKRRFKLPKLELLKFNGDVKNWIGFWGQFRKIHEDDDIDGGDKFQYLLQAMEPGTPARSLVESFPSSGVNYEKAVDQLKARFARDEVLIEVYVRELLSLVLKQATLSRTSGMTLTVLYDKLETQLRALESLGVTSNKYASMLYPLVESALPEDTLKIWERQRRSLKVEDAALTDKNNCSDNSVNYLTLLLDFLRNEVESEERIGLARTSFMNNKDSKSNTRSQAVEKQKMSQVNSESGHYTAATILSTGNGGNKFTNLCLFCENKSHASRDCSKARNFSIDERKDIVMKKKACFACLRQNHTIKRCKTFIKCIICGKRHLPILCPDLSIENTGDRVIEHQSSSKTEDGKQTSLVSNNATGTLLQTVAVKLVSGKNSMIVRALLDSASQRSYILKSCTENMNFRKVRNETIIQCVFGGIQSKPNVHSLYEVEIENLNNTFSCCVEALEQTKICNYSLKFQNIDLARELERRNIIISDFYVESNEISLLLGADIYGKLLTGRVEHIGKELVAIETHLGWTLTGLCNTNSSFETLCAFDAKDITDLWNLDVLGIVDPITTKNRDVVEAETMNHFYTTIKQNSENRYEVQLPWVEYGVKLSDNKELAYKRLVSTTKKLRTMGKYSDYDKIFKDWEKLGIIEEVSDENSTNMEHYIPHHPVIKESSTTTKIRPVFDASAKDKFGNALNDCLNKGPNLIELIPKILMQFRIGLIGVISDIKKAFLQISIAPPDRDVLRFLWWKNPSQNEVMIYRHSRVVFGVSSSPFLLAATLAYHLDIASKNLQKTAKKLSNSLYVDNCVTSVNSKAELETFIIESRTLLFAAQFELRGWIYNFPKLFEEEESEMPSNIDNVVSVLGLQWNLRNDTICCDVGNFSDSDKIPKTKRGLLSAAQRVFDPIGFTCPVTLLPKLLLQETWVTKCNWDGELPEEIGKKFKNWLSQIHLLSLCHIPRSICKFSPFENCKNSSIHVFCDASKLAYAACIFIRIEENEHVGINLLQAKSRIAPIKPITIPRLELLAAVIGCRLYQSVKKVEHFKYLKTYFWSDSTVVLTWIKTKSNWNTFITNRVAEISSHTDINQWNHVSGDKNAADLPSRGCSSKSLIVCHWWTGPEWLRESQEFWPNMTNTYNEKEAYCECRKGSISTMICEAGFSCSDFIVYFSKYSKIVRTLGWIWRFYEITRKVIVRKEKILMYEEYENAEIKLLKMLQSECFGGKDRSNFGNSQIIIDEKGLLRVETKLVFGEEPYNFKYPILLPYKHELVKRLIIQQHEASHHAGVQTLLGILRERFWIQKARRMVKEVIFKCVICKRFKTKALETPFAPLPKDRIKNAAAFEITGIDLAGPLFLKSLEKAWIVIFTYAVYRACHFEIVQSLSTEAFLNALRRFIAGRGRVAVIYTDNGGNFVGANNLLKELDWNVIIQYSTVKKIKWIFNPATAAWWGGWWERMVRIIKELLRKNLGKSRVNYEELMTLTCDCEAIINSRPLTYVYDNPNELSPITPALFIQGIKSTETPDLDIINRTSITKRHKVLQNMRDSLRQRFRSEYLANLVHVGQRRRDKLKIGDIVLIGSDNSKRINWPMGKILEIYPGKDKIARVAKIQLASGGQIVRPFQRIYPLEIYDHHDELITGGTLDTSNDDEKGIAVQVQETNDREEVQTRSNRISIMSKNDIEDKEVTTRYGRLVKKPKRLGY